MPVVSKESIGASQFCSRTIRQNASSGWHSKVVRRKTKLRFIGKLLRLCDVLCLQELNIRASEAGAFRDWLSVRGWSVRFNYATDSKWLGGAVCFRDKWARPYSVAHTVVVQSYVNAVSFSAGGSKVGVVGNLYFDSGANATLRNEPVSYTHLTLPTICSV